MRPETEKRMKRWAEQKWIIDKMIEAQRGPFSPVSTSPRMYTMPAAIDGELDLISVSLRVQRFADIPREFARIARKRETFAKKVEEEGHFITARDNYAAAACFYGDAQWAIFEDDNEECIAYNAKKIECYDKVIKYAPYPMERIEIPFEDKSLPGILHLPSNRPEKVPCILSIDGMDGFKEIMHPIYGDKYLTRGIAVLAIDGPGQGECCIRKIRVTADNFERVGKVCMDYLVSRPEVDPDRIGVTGVSFGSYWVTQIAATEDRFKAAAIALCCLEPGMYTIFNKAEPTFKLRFMYMTGYEDEEEFDRFAQTMTLKGVGAKIKCPFLIIAGEDDELSPIKYAYQLYDEIKAPKKIVVYQGAAHGLMGPTAFTGPEWRVLEADWIKDRLKGKAMESERILIDITGREIKQ